MKLSAHSIKIWLFIHLLTSSIVFAEDDPSRLRPPGKVECSRDHLTHYTGQVVEYRRQWGLTTLRIATDWGTIEAISLAHAGSDDPSGRFLIEGEIFEPSDWDLVESSPGRVRTGIRASAWACDDGSSPVIDWLPPKE
jgi:hypothetical protein